MRGWQAVLYGPVFFVFLHVMGWRHGNRKQRAWIAAETSLVVAAVWLVAVLRPGRALEFYAATMILGQCLTAFFAVWSMHHDVDPERTIPRTERGWRNALFLGMFYHLEHHLFPRVPTPNLPRLAARLDRVRPDLTRARVLPSISRR
jgi:fatty acid desaturase